MLTDKVLYDEKRKNINRKIQNLIDFNNLQEDEKNENLDIEIDSKNQIINEADDDQLDKVSLCSSEEERSLDSELTSMIKMLVESLIPFNLVHSSFYSNWLDYNYKKFRRPRLNQMINMFETMYQLSDSYIKQVLPGSSSYTLAFEFWKCGRRNYISLRASFLNVFEHQFPFLTCFKVFNDWTEEKYLHKVAGIFKHFGLERKKVFLCVTNFRSKVFKKALESYFGEDKVNFCIIHQLNAKISQVLLDCDFEDDIITNTKPLISNEIDNFSSDIDENNEVDETNEFIEPINNENKSDVEKLENKSITDFENNFNDNDEYDDDFSDLGDEKNLEELENVVQNENKELLQKDFHEIFNAEMSIEDFYKSFENYDTSQKPLFLRVIFSLIKSFTYMVLNKNLLEIFDDITADKNGSRFKFYFLYSIKNWNNLYSFTFYFKAIKEEFFDFISSNSEIPFEFKKEDLDFIDDLFSILVVFKEKMNLLSLQNSVNLSKTLQIFSDFHKALDKEKLISSEGNEIKDKFLSFFNSKINFMQKDIYYGVASLLDPTCSSNDFKTVEDYRNCIQVLHEVLCYKLDEKFNFALYKIRKPLEMEVDKYLRRRPMVLNHSFLEFQLKSPVLRLLAYDYLSATAICTKPLYIHHETKEQTILSLSKIREDSLEKILKLNSIDEDYLTKIINNSKFWV